MSGFVLTSDSLIGSPASGNIEYSGQFYGTDTNNARAQFERLVLATSQNSTSGTSIDFTGIPAWAKRITVMFNGVSTNGTSLHQVQLGTGSTTFATSGYAGASMNTNSGAVGTTNYTSGLVNQASASAASINVGHAIFTNVSGNIWVGSITTARTESNFVGFGSTVITLGAVLTGVRITTVNGTDTFDAGSINILYEG